MRCRGRGARPSEGSSSISSRGLVSKAREIATACCSPPESWDAGWRRRVAIHGNMAKTRVHGPRPGPGTVAAGQQVFLDVERTEEAPPLGHEHDAGADALFRREASYVDAVQENGARRRLMKPGNRAQERRFPGPVGADYAEHLPGAHRQAHSAHGLQLPVPDGQFTHLEERGHMVSPICSAAGLRPGRSSGTHGSSVPR